MVSMPLYTSISILFFLSGNLKGNSCSPYGMLSLDKYLNVSLIFLTRFLGGTLFPIAPVPDFAYFNLLKLMHSSS